MNDRLLILNVKLMIRVVIRINKIVYFLKRNQLIIQILKG